jgi:hypothetical protein
MNGTEPTTCNFSEPLGVLPRSYRIHWTPSRKAQVVRAVQTGVLSFDDARKRYKLSHSEFLGWKHALAQKGLEGLQLH